MLWAASDEVAGGEMEDRVESGSCLFGEVLHVVLWFVCLWVYSKRSI